MEYAAADGSLYMREITRAEFDGLVRPILDRTMGPVKMALADAKLAAERNGRSGAGGRLDARAAGARMVSNFSAARRMRN